MEVNKTLTDVERSFNIAGAIPVVAIGSSIIRMAASKIQFLAGLIFALIGLIGQIFSSNVKKYEDMTHMGGEHILHGFLNSVRALGEFILAVTIVGSLGLLAYQSFAEKKFEPIIPYTIQQPDAEPLHSEGLV